MTGLGLLLLALPLTALADIIHFSSNQGTIQSDQYPNPYENQFNRRWIVNLTEPSNFITLTFSMPFDVEGYENTPCFYYDWLAIYSLKTAPNLGSVCERSNAFAADLGLFCNHYNVPSTTLNIKGDFFVVEFCTDDVVQGNGFKLSWTASPNPATITPPVTTPATPVCGGTITLPSQGATANITSPNYPGIYPNNMDCWWTLTAPANEHIRLDSETFQLEGYDCRFDYVEVIDDAVGSSMKYCGPDTFGVFWSVENTLRVHFHSDSQGQYGGFVLDALNVGIITTTTTTTQFPANYTGTFPTTTTTPTTGPPTCDDGVVFQNIGDVYLLTSPNYPFNYPPNAACLYYVIANVSDIEKVSIQFTFFDFHTEAVFDFLEVTNDEDIDIVYMGTVPQGRVVVFDTNRLLLGFVSDDSDEERGFEILVTLIPRPFQCATGEFKCATTNACIPYTKRCDGTNDCTDKSDEDPKFCNLQQTCGISKISPNINIPPDHRPMSRVNNGTEAKPGSWPWVVPLISDVDTDYPFGGGVLISDRWVLTTAQFFDDKPMQDPSSFLVKVGAHNIQLPESWQSQILVDSIHIHPAYDPQTHANDIALLRLQDEVPTPFNDHINVGCLPPADTDIADGSWCVIAGWGADAKGFSQQVLQQAVVPVMSNRDCNDKNHYDGLLDLGSQMCAGFRDGGVALCEGDEGTPLVCQGTDQRWYVQGIYSFARDPCASASNPGVYTRVSAFITFITETMSRYD